jgi:hypothetical protein
MFRNGLRSKTLWKNTLAALLTITLSGAYCLFCCPEIIAAGKAAHHQAGQTNRTQHCSFSKNDKTSDDKTSGAAKAATAAVKAFECFPLRFSFFIAKLEKKEFPKQNPVLANDFFGFPASVKLAPRAGFAGFSYRAPVRESRDLHIKNCVFRI